MQKKEKVAISISADILKKVDAKVDRVKYKNRSHVIEDFVRKGLELKESIGAIVVANENRWEGGRYKLMYSKNLIEVDGKKLIEKQIEALLTSQITEIVVAVSDETIDVKEFVNNKKYAAHISFIQVDETADSGEIFEKGRALLQTKKIIFLLGDNYFYNLSYTDLLYFHNTSQSELTIVVKPEKESQKFGNIELQGNSIVNFEERPSGQNTGSHIVNTGLYIINSEILPKKKGNYKLEYDFFPQYIKKYGARAYFHNGPWFHVQSDEVLRALT